MSEPKMEPAESGEVAGYPMEYEASSLLNPEPEINHSHAHSHDHSDDHNHDHSGGLCGKFMRTKSSRLVCMLLMVLVVFVVEMFVGQYTNSLTLVADSFHMLSDALALVVGLIAVTYSKRRAHEYLKPWFSRKKYSNTFGWVRFEVVGALVNATFLLALCLSIALEAVEKFMNPSLPNNPQLVLIVGSGGLLVNLIGLVMFGGHAGHSHDHDHDHGNKKEKDGSKRSLKDVESSDSRKVTAHTDDQMNMRGVFLHVLGDALGSVVVIITALVVLYVPHKLEIEERALTFTCNCTTTETVEINHWILYLDPGMSLILVIILCFTTIPLFKQSSLVLLQSVPVHINITELQRTIRKVPGIDFIHDFHVWQLTGEKLVATIHIQVKDAEVYARVASELKTKLCQAGIHSTTIQPEFDSGNAPKCEMACESTDACQTKRCCTTQDALIANQALLPNKKISTA